MDVSGWMHASVSKQWLLAPLILSLKKTSFVVWCYVNEKIQVMYLLFITALWGMVQMTQLMSVATSTTFVNVTHGLVSFALLC